MLLNDEQRLLIQTARQFVTKELLPLEKAVEAQDHLTDEVARSITKKSIEYGFYASNVPTAHGGTGLNAFDSSLIEEEFGRTSDILVRRALGGVYDMLFYLEGEQRDRWLIPSIHGDRVAAVGFTEPSGGSDAAGIKTKAVPTEHGWKLSGQKCYISDGAYADYFVVTAVTGEQGGKPRISLFLVDKGVPGFTVGPSQPMMGSRGTSHTDLFFDDVQLTPINLIGREGDGLRLMLSSMSRIRVMHIGARSVGKAVRLLELMIEYAQDRVQFGRAIGNYQFVQQMVTDSALDVETTRLLVRQAAMELDHGIDNRHKISMLKVHASEALGRVADRAVQLFAGMGYSKEHLAEKIYRDARLYRIIDGTSEIHRMVVARDLLKHGKALIDPLN
jgi:acyl-CoA dehydrogenase